MVDERGWLRSERRCGRCASGWKRGWKLRSAGAPGLPPLVLERHVCFGGLDNRVQCVRPESGHRVFSVALEGRVRRPLTAWRATAQENEVLLAVLEQGSSLILLGLRDGHKLASFVLPPDEGTFVGAPLTRHDGLLVLARQDYAPESAALLLFRIESQPAARTTSSVSPAATSAPSSQRISTTSASSGSSPAP
jgi:hypothetical protein